MKKILWIVTIIVCVTSAGWIWVLITAINGHTYLDTEGTAEIWKNDASTVTLPAGQRIDVQQRITVSQNNLSRLLLYVKNQQPITLNCAISDMTTGQQIRQASSAPVQPDDIVPIIWTFEPIPDSSNRQYTIAITGEATDAPLSVFAVESGQPDNGQLSIDGQPVDDYHIVLDWQYYSAHPWHTLLRRLTYAKPGILNLPSAYMIIFCLYGLVSMGTLGAFAWYLMNSDNDQAPKKSPDEKNR